MLEHFLLGSASVKTCHKNTQLKMGILVKGGENLMPVPLDTYSECKKSCFGSFSLISAVDT